LFLFAAPWIQRRESIQSADAVLMLMGSIGDRVLAVHDLWQAQKTSRILFCEESNQHLKGLVRRGVHIQSSNDQVKSAFRQLGIPDSCLTFISGNANSTLDEARMVFSYLKQSYSTRKAPFRLVIVTSLSHTRRAYFIFRRALRDLSFPVEISTHPSPYSRKITYTWFLSREQTQIVLSEYTKILAWFLFDQWKF
jgi:uncharacterized SAM-binding protein YcdF (DUF218 family)